LRVFFFLLSLFLQLTSLVVLFVALILVVAAGTDFCDDQLHNLSAKSVYLPTIQKLYQYYDWIMILLTKVPDQLEMNHRYGFFIPPPLFVV
jgi:hypothetical protein